MPHGERPIEELTEQELEEWRQAMVRVRAMRADPLITMCRYLVSLTRDALRDNPEVHARFARTFQDHVPTMTREDWELCRALAVVRSFWMNDGRPVQCDTATEGFGVASVIAARIEDHR